MFLTFWLGNVLRATTACTFSTPNFQKWSDHGVFCTFWLRNVLRATTACTFSTSQLPTSKSGPNLVCFVHFDFEMCFAPQRRSLFRHLNFQKWSDNGVFCTFWLANVLRATTACNCSSRSMSPPHASLTLDQLPVSDMALLGGGSWLHSQHQHHSGSWGPSSSQGVAPSTCRGMEAP